MENISLPAENVPAGQLRYDDRHIKLATGYSKKAGSYSGFGTGPGFFGGDGRLGGGKEGSENPSAERTIREVWAGFITTVIMTTID